MDRYRIYKVIALLRFYLARIIFLKSGRVNFFDANVKFCRRKKISIGSRNRFYSYSNISVDGFENNQHISLGDRNVIAQFSILKSHGGYIEIGDNNFIGERVQVQGRGGVSIGSNCMIAANTFISSSNHNAHDPLSEDYLRREVPEKTTIGDSVWIGANCTLVAGSQIGDYCIIGAGSVVKNNVVAYSMIAGNPAKLIKQYDHQLKRWMKV